MKGGALEWKRLKAFLISALPLSCPFCLYHREAEVGKGQRPSHGILVGKLTDADESSGAELAAGRALAMERAEVVPAGPIDTRVALTLIYVYNAEGKDSVRAAMRFWKILFQQAALCQNVW